MPVMLKKKFRRAVERIITVPDRVAVADYATIDGFLSLREAANLHRFARYVPENGLAVEIGSWQGKSTYCLAKGLRGGAKLIAIDPFDASGGADTASAQVYHDKAGDMPLADIFRRNMKQRGVFERIEMWHGTSNVFVERINKIGAIDLLFIDGDHSVEGARFDFDHYAGLINVGGFVLLHDFDKNRLDLGPTWVVNERIRPSSDWAFVGLFDTLWVARRIAKA